jgi:hypothetical protein
LHDDFSQLSFRESNRKREISIADPRDEINTSEKKCLRIPRCMGLLTLIKPTKPAGFCTLAARLHFPPVFHTRNHCRHFLALRHLFTFVAP